MTTISVSSAIALVDDRKTAPAQVPVGQGTRRSRMQQPIAAFCTRAQTLTRACPCATCIWLLHPAPTSSQDGLDPQQLVLVVFFQS